MSNFYLCDAYANKSIDVWLDTCHCRAYGMEHVPKRAMYDYHGKDGKRYDEPKEVCEHYEPRSDG